MRILHVFDHSLPLQSGYVSRSLGIIRNQQSRGWHTVHVTGPRHKAADATIETVDGLKFYRTPGVGTGLPGLREALEMRAMRQRLVEIVRVERPDVIHAHSPVLNVVPALLVARQFGLPIVYEVRAFWEDAAVDHGTTREGALRYRLSRLLDTWAMRHVDCVAPICEPMRQEIIARGIAASKVRVVPNCVDRSLLSEVAPTFGENGLRSQLGIKDQFVLGFVGSFYAYEGLDLLLEAAAALRDKSLNIFVLLVGGGPEKERLGALVKKYRLEDFVQFTGRVNHSDVEKYYNIIDLLVFPRKRMRLTDLVTPLKPLEAMAQLKPVLASDVGGHRELIKDGRTGFLFPAADVRAMVSCVERLIASPDERADITAQGRRYVEAERTWDRLMDRYSSIYAAIGVRG